MNMRLEVIVIPVSNTDLSKEFYENLGWRLDADIKKGDDYRVIQFTPPGSACAIIFGVGLSKAKPGSYQDLTLVVDDIEKARSELVSHGVEVSEIFHGGIFGNTGRIPGLDPERKSYSSLVSFYDPDGNGWLVQEITKRLPGR
jgi:catechol 2,3-dioxygenase-like lactoylglutathione lyase family enzyme